MAAKRYYYIKTHKVDNIQMFKYYISDILRWLFLPLISTSTTFHYIIILYIDQYY